MLWSQTTTQILLPTGAALLIFNTSTNLLAIAFLTVIFQPPAESAPLAARVGPSLGIADDRETIGLAKAMMGSSSAAAVAGRRRQQQAERRRRRSTTVVRRGADKEHSSLLLPYSDDEPSNAGQNEEDEAARRKQHNYVRYTASAHQERLYQRVISNEQLARPDLTEIPINVTVRVILIKLQDLVEKSELIETTVRIQIGWRDRRLMWNRDDFGGITEILLPSSSVWIPDLAIINSVSDVYSVVRDTRFEIKVQDNGQLWWHPTGVLRTFCKLHLSYFPFDRQKCSIIVESPTFDHRFLNLRLRSERTPVDLRMYVESETWRLENTFGTSQHIKAGVSTYFSRIEFWLILDRARLYHSINFILPCFILSAIQTVFFFLPATHPQRVGSTTVTMLSVMVFQSMVVAQLPKTSESVPLLSIYIDLVILVSATSVCASIFTAMCHFNNDRLLPIPNWLQACCRCRRGSAAAAARGTTSLRTGRASPVPGRRQQRLQSPRARPANRRDMITKRGRQQPAQEQQSLLQQPQHKVMRTTASPAVATGYQPSPTPSSHQHHLSTLRDIRDPGLREIYTDPASIGAEPDTHHQHALLAVGSSPAEQRQSATKRPTFSSECEAMTTFSEVPVEKDSEGNVLPRHEQPMSWLDILMCIDRGLNWTCALAISLGPALIFGIIPNVVEHQDYPEPLGYNFTLLKSSQIRRPPKPTV